MTNINRICVICGSPFMSANGKGKYCSDECKKEGWRRNQARWREEHPDYHKQYYLGHPETKEKFAEKHPTYGRDRSRRNRGSREYTKICLECGKTFTTWNPNKGTCSDECRAAHRKARDSHRVRTPRSPEEEHRRFIIRTYGSEEAHMAYLEELEQKKQAHKARREQERDEQRRARQKQMEEAKRKREERKEANYRIGKCVVCGNEFDTYNPAQKTCSKECGKKLAHAHKHKRIPKSQLVDKDITLEALYRRDSGVCRLCGKKCDWSDKTDKSVGPTYPSIDHIIPVSRGGLHAWNNVQLAHFECNWKKSDTLIER